LRFDRLYREVAYEHRSHDIKNKHERGSGHGGYAIAERNL
jgi:hypothetical protein